MADLNRREFVALTVLGACACCDTEAAEPTTKPTTRPATKPAAPVGGVNAGSLDQYAEDGVYDEQRQTGKFVIIRKEGKLYAASARCTHKGCVLKADGKTSLRCPCHGSVFDLTGTPSGGPAKTSLFRYAIALKNNEVIVNPKKQFAEKDWEKAGAFVTLT